MKKLQLLLTGVLFSGMLGAQKDKYWNYSEIETANSDSVFILSIREGDNVSSLDQFQNLEELTIYDQDNVPEGIDNLPNLKELSIGRSGISDVSFLRNLELHSLELRTNGMTDFPAEILSISTLKNLVFIEPEVNHIPEKIGGLSHLESLQLGGRVYTAEPESFKYTGTNVSDLPSSLASISTLKSIDISGCPIGAIPEWMYAKQELSELWVPGTQITSIPSALLDAERSNMLSIGVDSKQGFDKDTAKRIREAKKQNGRGISMRQAGRGMKLIVHTYYFN